MPLFEIAFQGQVRSGVTEEQARARIGQLFQVGAEQLDVLFSGRRVVIKQGLEQAAAEKYRQAIERAGALCTIDPMETGGAAADSAPGPAPQAAPTPDRTQTQATPAAPAPAAAGKVSVEPRDAYMAAFKDVEAPDFGVAPTGTDMQDEYNDFTPLPIDLSALSLAPPGADLDELKRSTDAKVPNTDHLKLED